MSRVGKKFVFHGAFGSKKKAVSKERSVGHSFIMKTFIRGRKRYEVVTKRGQGE